MDLAVVDLAGLDSSATARTRAAAALDASWRGFGYATVVRHGVHPRLVARTFDALRAFFAQPPHVKCAVRARATGYVDGPVEAFVAHPGDDPRRAANRWPADAVGFRETVVAYLAAATSVADRLTRLAATVADGQARPQAPGSLTLRAERYGPGAILADAPVRTVSDLAVIAADGVDGLEVRAAGGAWVPVRVSRGALVVLPGTALAAASGYRWAAAEHRVRLAGSARLVVSLSCGTDDAGGVRVPASASRVA